MSFLVASVELNVNAFVLSRMLLLILSFKKYFLSFQMNEMNLSRGCHLIIHNSIKSITKQIQLKIFTFFGGVTFWLKVKID